MKLNPLIKLILPSSKSFPSAVEPNDFGSHLFSLAPQIVEVLIHSEITHG